jgi:hypothetical protein
MPCACVVLFRVLCSDTLVFSFSLGKSILNGSQSPYFIYLGKS